MTQSVDPPQQIISVEEEFDSSFFYPLYYPFTNKAALPHLWWLAILMYFPPINLFLIRGWRLELVSRLSAGLDPIYPPAAGIPKYLLKGIVLWGMTFTYTVFPTLLILVFGLGGITDTLSDIYTLIMIVFQKSEMTFSQFLWNEGGETISCFTIAGIWAAVSLPLYRAGMIRYSVTGNLAAFWNLPANIAFIARHAQEFVRMYTGVFVDWFLVSVASAILLQSVVFAFIVPATFLLIPFWSSGYEYGKLARKLWLELEAASCNSN